MNVFNLSNLFGTMTNKLQRKPARTRLECENLENREMLSGNPLNISNANYPSAHYINVSFNWMGGLDYVIRDTENGVNRSSLSTVRVAVSEINISTDSGADWIVIDLGGAYSAPPVPVRVNAGGDRDILEIRNAVGDCGTWSITGVEAGTQHRDGIPDPVLNFSGIDVVKTGTGNFGRVSSLKVEFFPGAVMDEFLVSNPSPVSVYDFVTLDLSRLSTGMTVNLGDRSLGGNLFAEGFNAVLGTSGNDRIIGSDRNEMLLGNGGNDTLMGFGGSDKLVGGAGSDWLYGDQGADLLIGGTEADWLEGGAGGDTVINGWTIYDQDLFALRTQIQGLVDARSMEARWGVPVTVFDDWASDTFAIRSNTSDAVGDWNFVEPLTPIYRTVYGRRVLVNTIGDRFVTV